MTIEWSEPPPETRGGYYHGKGEHAEFADELRAHPGEWAIFKRIPDGIDLKSSRQSAYSMASRIAKGKNASFGTGFESVSRRLEDEKVTAVYVRFIDDGMCTASSWRGHGHQPYGPGNFNRCVKERDHGDTHKDDFGNVWVS